MPQNYNTDYAEVARLLSESIKADKEQHDVPMVDTETGFFTGQYYDDRKGTPEGQPGTRRTQNYLSYLSEKTGGRFSPKVGRPIPGFDHVDEYESDGFFDSIGNVLSGAYNQSLTGMADKALTGEDRFDVSHWNPSTMEKLGVEIASFFMPLDMATLVVGGGAGGAVAKTVMTKAISKAVAKKVIGGMGKVAARKSVGKMVQGIAKSAGGLGAYSGTGEALRQKVSGEEADFIKIFTEVAKGATLGGMMGVGGALVPKSAGLLGREAAHAGTGVAVLGGVAPLLEGELPSLESVGEAAKFIVGIRLAQGAIKAPTAIKRKYKINKAIRELEAKMEKEGLSIEEATTRLLGGAKREKIVDVEKKAISQKQFAREVKSKGKKSVLRMVNPKKGSTLKEQYAHYRKALKVAVEKDGRLYLGKTQSKLVKMLQKRGLVSDKPSGKGGYYAITPEVKRTNLEILERAYKRKSIDEPTYTATKQFMLEHPQLDSKIAVRFHRAELKIDADNSAIGRTTSKDMKKTIRKTMIELYRGATADTYAHEWYHAFWFEGLTKGERKRFTKWYDGKSGKKAKDVLEEWAEIGSGYHWSGKLKTGSGVFKRFFDKARDMMNNIIGRVREVRGNQIPKEIVDMYRRTKVRVKVDSKLPGKQKVKYRHPKVKLLPDAKGKYTAGKYPGKLVSGKGRVVTEVDRKKEQKKQGYIAKLKAKFKREAPLVPLLEWKPRIKADLPKHKLLMEKKDFTIRDGVFTTGYFNKKGVWVGPGKLVEAKDINRLSVGMKIYYQLPRHRGPKKTTIHDIIKNEKTGKIEKVVIKDGSAGEVFLRPDQVAIPAGTMANRRNTQKLASFTPERRKEIRKNAKEYDELLNKYWDLFITEREVSAVYKAMRFGGTEREINVAKNEILGMARDNIGKILKLADPQNMADRGVALGKLKEYIRNPKTKKRVDPDTGTPWDAPFQTRKSISLNGGVMGGHVVHPSARRKDKIQVTGFTKKGQASGHMEYNSVAEALADYPYVNHIEHPVFRLRKNNIKASIKAWQEATFEHPYKDELVKIDYVYVSPLRPLSGVMVKGRTSANKDGRIGVLYRKEPLSLSKQESLDLFPISSKAILSSTKEYALKNYPELKPEKELTPVGPKDGIAYQTRLAHKVAAKKLGALENFKRIASAMTPDVVKQMGNRLTTESAKVFKKVLLTGDNVWHRLSGTFMSEFSGAGVGGKKKILKADVEAGKHPEVSRVMDRIYDMGESVGLKFGRIKNYVPNVIKSDLRQKLWDDVKALDMEIKALESSGTKITYSDKAVAAMMRKRSKPLSEALDFLIKTKQVKNYVDALSKLSKELTVDPFGKSPYEQKRQLKLPSKFYETDLSQIVPHYVETMTRRIAMAEVMGVDAKGRVGTKMLKILDKLRAEDYDQYKVALKGLAMWTGAYEAQHGFTGRARQIADAYTAIEFGTKIALGRATLLNLAQPAISIIPDLGIFHTIRGGMKLFDPAVRQQIRRTGAINPYMMQAMTGYIPSGIFGRFSQKMAKYSGFTGVNKGLAYLAASSFKIAVQDWHRLANRPGLRQKWAKDRLKDFGLSHRKKITENQMVENMYRFATDSQLQRNILRDPIIMNEPKMRPLFLFKRFGYRQFTYIKDMITTEAKRGNLLPVVRLAAAGFLGGELIHAGLNQIQSLLSGEPAYREDSLEHEPVKRMINNIAIIGAFGAVGDIMDIERMSGAMNWAKFTVLPVFASDFEKVAQAYTKFAGDYERYGDGWLATKRNAHSITGFLGTYPRYAGKRLYTDAQTERRAKYLKGKARMEIFDLLLNGHGEAASDHLEKWNKNYPKETLGHSDVSLSALRKYLKGKLRRFIEADGNMSPIEKRKALKKLNNQLKSSARIK